MKIAKNLVMQRILYVLFIVLSITSLSVSQDKLDFNKKFKIGLSARSYGDSIYIRWAVTDPIAWRLFKEHGFVIERAKVQSNGRVDKYNKLSDSPFKPWSYEKWEEYFNSREQLDQSQLDNEAIAFLYGIGERDDEAKSDLIKNQSEESDFMKSLREKKSSQEWAVLITMLASSNSLIAAEGLGLFYVDKNVNLNENYSYRIYSLYKDNLYSFDTTYIQIQNVKFDPKVSLQNLAVNENDGSIEIIWSTDPQFITYNVERSEDGKSFKQLNDAPLLTLKNAPDTTLKGIDSFLDTLVINYKPYTYRVYAKTIFADEIKLGEITAMGRDRTPPEQPYLPQPVHIDEKKIKISWQMADPPAKDLAGFYIGRDSLVNGKFNYIHKGMLPSSAREFIDTTFSLNANNFYLVIAVDTAGNKSESYPAYVVLNDTTPPLPPKWKEAFMDSNGVVTLRLLPNKEFDLMGYRILKANSPEHEFSSFIESFGNDSIDFSSITEFKDTVDLQTTTKYIYYVATALDKRYNESSFSEIIAVPRPDRVPPITPVLSDVKVTDKDVSLYFIPSESEDVKNHFVLRRIAEGEKWDTIAVLNAKDSTYTDKNVKQNILYQYALYATDSSGLKSDLSFVLEARPYYLGILPEIKNFTLSFNEKENSATLNWEYDNISEITFVVYRSFDKQPLVRYKSINNSNARNFVDKDFSNGKGSYKYALKVYDKFGGESKLTEIKELTIK